VRAETRHQLKQDRFSKVTIEAAENAAHWTAEHQSKVVAAVIAVVVIAAIALGGWYYISQQDEKASSELSTAVRTFETPIRPRACPRNRDLRPSPHRRSAPPQRANSSRTLSTSIRTRTRPIWRAILWD